MLIKYDTTKVKFHRLAYIYDRSKVSKTSRDFQLASTNKAFAEPIGRAHLCYCRYMSNCELLTGYIYANIQLEANAICRPAVCCHFIANPFNLGKKVVYAAWIYSRLY